MAKKSAKKSKSVARSPKQLAKKGGAGPKSVGKKGAKAALGPASALRARKAAGPVSVAGRHKAADIILLVILAVLVYIFIAGPFQRGLFFAKELLPVHIISFALFILWCVSRLLRGEGALLKTPLDYCVLALVVFYFLSFFVAANKSAALWEFMKVANYFVIYLLVFDLCRRDPCALFRKDREKTAEKTAKAQQKAGEAAQPVLETWAATSLSFILHILLAAGTAVALGGLGTAAGTWELHGAYVGGRIHTSLQYPNTAAAYLTAVYFIALGLVTRVKRWYLRPVYLAPAVVIFITFIFTYSRGAWLLMPLLAVLFVLVVGRGERLRLVFYLSLSGLVTLLLVSRLDSALRGDNPALVWKYVFLAVLLILAGGLLAELFLSLRWKLQAAVAGVVALVIVVVGLQVVLPALGRPLHLARKPDEPPGHQYLEQRVGKISPSEKYMLALEVAATQETPGGDEAEKKVPDYAWRLLVLAYDREEERTTLLDHREGPTQGWEQREFELQPGEHTRRMEVRLYNYYPGTAVSARNVSLRDSRGERLLTFALNRMLPDRIYSRMFAISAGDKSVEGRLTFYRDALKIIRDYPLLGAGGGGWEALYFGYQEQRYHTTEVHNHFLQVWVEAGTPGFLAFVGIWVFFILSFWRRCFGRGGASTAEKHYWSTVCVPAVALGVHSAIDFNLSLGAVSIFLFALLGAGRSLDWDEGEGFVASLASGWRRKASSLSGLPSAVSAVGILAGIFMLTLSVSLWNGYRYGVEAEQRAGENRLPEAVELYDKAISYDPYQASYYAALGRIYENLANTEGNSDLAPRLQEMALDLTRRAQELEPFNPRYSLEYGAMLLRSGSIDAGLHCLERVIELSPQNPVFFVQVARGRLAAAEHYLALEDASQAGEQLREVLRLEERMSKLQGSAAPLNFYLGKAAYLLEDYARAASYLAEVGEKDENYEESLVYLAVLFEKQGEGEQAAELKEIFSANEALLELYRQLAASR